MENARLKSMCRMPLASFGWQTKAAVVSRVGKARQEIAVGQLLDRHQGHFEFVPQIAAHRPGQVAGKAFVQLADAVQLLLAQQARLMQIPRLDQRAQGGAVVLRRSAARGPK